MNGNHYPAKRDFRAAAFVREERDLRGLTPQDLAAAITALATKSTDAHRYTVSSRTIYRIEEEGAVPGPRIKFALATFFGIPMAEIWVPRRTRRKEISA